MSAPANESVLRFQAMSFGVDRRDAVTVGFEMERRQGHDSRGILISRALREDGRHDSSVYVEFGEPQQYCMEGGIKKVDAGLGILRIEFTEAGALKMAGLRTVEILYDGSAAPDILDALDYIFQGFDGYIRNA